MGVAAREQDLRSERRQKIDTAEKEQQLERDRARIEELKKQLADPPPAPRAAAWVTLLRSEVFSFLMAMSMWALLFLANRLLKGLQQVNPSTDRQTQSPASSA
jgi:hypothetical protein